MFINRSSGRDAGVDTDIARPSHMMIAIMPALEYLSTYRSVYNSDYGGNLLIANRQSALWMDR